MRFDHVNLRPRDMERMRDFLVAVLGLTVGERPPFAFPGYWLCDGDGRPVVHLQPAADGPAAGEPLVNHIAFGPFDYDAALARLRAAGLTFRLSRIPATPIRQIFVDGPEGLRVELQAPEADPGGG